MQIDLLTIDELNATLLDGWLEQHRRAHDLASPFFHPAYTLAVARHRDVRIVLLHHRGTPRAFVPFAPMDGVDGELPARTITGRQGALTAEFTALDATRVLDATGLRSLRFERAPVNQVWLAPHGRPSTGSSVANVAGGFAAYLHRRGAEGEWLEQWYRRRTAAVIEEHGSLTVTFDDSDLALLPLLSQWRARDDRTDDALLDALATDLVGRDTDGFSTVLTSVRAGSTVLGLHLALRSGSTLHSWITAVNPRATHHAPGTLTLVAVLGLAPQHRLTTVDLGEGDEEYRRVLRTGVVPMMQGWVRASTVTRRVARARGVGDRLLQRVLADESTR